MGDSLGDYLAAGVQIDGTLPIIRGEVIPVYGG